MAAICMTYGGKHIATVYHIEQGGWAISLCDPEADTVRIEEGEDATEAIARYQERMRRLYRLFDEVDKIPDPYSDDND